MLMLYTYIDRADYETARAWGVSTAVNIYGCDPEAIRSRECIVRFTHQLCELLGLKMFGETQVVRFSDDPQKSGYSMVQLIETSLVSAHFAEDCNAVYLDIFGSKWYDAEAAAAFAQDFFRAESVQIQKCLRQ